MVSTTAAEASSYQRGDIEKAMANDRQVSARVSGGDDDHEGGECDAPDDLNNGRQALIAIPLVKETRGRYEALAQSTACRRCCRKSGRRIADHALEAGDAVQGHD